MPESITILQVISHPDMRLPLANLGLSQNLSEQQAFHCSYNIRSLQELSEQNSNNSKFYIDLVYLLIFSSSETLQTQEDSKGYFRT
jgi:hypothetical protein